MPRLGGAIAVGAGILLSRIAGLVRERVIAHYLGLSPAAAAFRAALRIPNLLQNLLGEGVLSASFIPVYSRLLAEGRVEEASKVARVVGTLLALVAGLVALLGVAVAGPLVDILAPGFDDRTRALTVELVRILFPGTALLVMSAWCLGVLNSHRRFFLSYVSPVLWNAAIIAAAIAAGTRYADSDADIGMWLAIGAAVGGALQFLVQLPTVIRLLRGLAPSLDTADPGVRATLRAFVPTLFGRGSVQLSAYLDQVIASYLGEAMVAAIAYAQTLYLLPISVFGMAISAAELPEMSGATGGASERAAHLQKRLASSLRRVMFLVVPSMVAFVAIGGPLVALLFQSGRFDARETEIVWAILVGSALGLVPNTTGRLLASALYAIGQPRAPLRAALVRVTLNAALGFAVALPLRDAFGYGPVLGAALLTASASAAAVVEMLLLWRALGERIGRVPLPMKFLFGALAMASVAGGVAAATAYVVLPDATPDWLVGIVAAGVFGATYLALAVIAKVPEVSAITRRLRR